MYLHVFRKKVLAGCITALSTVLAGCQGVGGPLGTKHSSSSSKPFNLGEISETFVVSSLADSGPGTLREAIELANSSPGTDKIIFRSDGGLYSEPQTIVLKARLPEVTDNLLIDGYIDNMLWKASGVTLDGDVAHQIFDVVPGTSFKVAYLTLSNGRSENGGAMSNSGDTVIYACMIRDNSASQSGGALHNRGRLTIINSTLYANEAAVKGGAIFNNGGNIALTHVTLTGNGAEKGGGVSNRGKLAINNSILYDNIELADHKPSDCSSSFFSRTESSNSVVGSSDNCGRHFGNADPGLGLPGHYNGPTQSIPISAGHSAFNWADNSLSLNEHGDTLIWDQRGNGDPRFASGIADIGAFEIQPIVKIEVDTTETGDIRGCTSAKGDCSFLGALALTNASNKHNAITFDRVVFKSPVTLVLDNAPKIQMGLSIDASGSGTVTLKLGSEGFAKASSDVRINLTNVELSP